MLFPNYTGENNPYVDPEHRYMLFAVYRLDDRYGKEVIYISKRKRTLGQHLRFWVNLSTPIIMIPVHSSARMVNICFLFQIG